MFTDSTISIQEEQEETCLEEIIEVSLDILRYRAETTDPNNLKYIDILKKEISDLQEWRGNQDIPFSAGILNEALFYISCKNNLQVDIFPSTGEEDVRGIDFFLGPAKHPIDVTTSPQKYPFKVYNQEKITLLLPGVSKIQDLTVDRREFLNNVYHLNMQILNNRFPEYKVLVKADKIRKGKKRKVTSLATSGKYKSKNKSEDDCGNLIIMDKKRYDSFILVLSMIKNLST